MNSKFSPKITEILAYSKEEATRFSSRSVGPEHLLLAMFRVDGGMTKNILRILNTDIAKIRTSLETKLRTSNTGNARLNADDIDLNEHATNILRLAVLEARLDRSQQVEEQHLLLGMLHDSVMNGAREVLENNDITYPDLKQILNKKSSTTNGISLPDEDEDEDDMDTPDDGKQAMGGGSHHTDTKTKKNTKTPILDIRSMLPRRLRRTVIW